jgi:hypothetical protein
MKKTILLLCVMIMVTFTFSLSALADKYSDAKDAYDKFISGYEQIRSINKQEMKDLVNAMCSADDQQRTSVGKSAAERLENDTRSKYDELKQAKERAEALINEIKSDEQYKDKWDYLKDFQNRINEVWPRIERIVEKCRAGNNPVFAAMSRFGMQAHLEYQSLHSSEGIKEFEVSSGKIDFLNWNTCTCVEIKANNSSSISKGRQQLERYISDLKKPEYFNKLLEYNSEAKEKFAKCKGEFNKKIACYIYCPEIDDNGDMLSASLGWGDCD